MSSPVPLRATSISIKYGDREAVSDLDLDVQAGEIVCLLGGNGAGKTSTLLAFLGLVTPSRGTVEVAGRAVGDAPDEARRRLAYLPEHVALYPALSGVENLRYLSALWGGARDDRAWRDLLARVGLRWSDAERPVSTLSKGMRQKLGIALALARDAEALLLDEPTSGLDPTAARELEVLVQQFARAGGAVLMVTHDLFRARQTGDRIGIMRQGRLTAMRMASELDAPTLERVYLTESGAA